MDYRREKELRQIIADAKQTISDAYQEIAIGEADNLWNAGDLDGALVRISNSTIDLVDYCRERGLTDAEAREAIHNAPIDWS